MKTLKNLAATLLVVTGSCAALAAGPILPVNDCKFQGLTVYKGSTAKVALSCPQNVELTLVGENNSPCRAASQLIRAFTNVTRGADVDLLIQLDTIHNIDGSSRDEYGVVSGTINGQPALATPNKCNDTHILVKRTR